MRISTALNIVISPVQDTILGPFGVLQQRNPKVSSWDNSGSELSKMQERLHEVCSQCVLLNQLAGGD